MTDPAENTYVVATIKSWNISEFHERTPAFPGRWHLISDPKDLTAPALAALNPRYVFFPHWSWKVPEDILSNLECVCFHMTDLPYGRGGSPLQNLIVRGHKETKITALRMVMEYDAGPIYMKHPLDLAGRAQDIFERAAPIIFDMIEKIALSEPTPSPQDGEPTLFARRTPEQSEIPSGSSLPSLYDHIRMLDAEGYPRAYLDHGAVRIEFSHAQLNSDAAGETVTATATILRRKSEGADE